MSQEIGGYAWHRIADLPATREEGSQTFVSDDGTKHKFFMVGPGSHLLKQSCIMQWPVCGARGAVRHTCTGYQLRPV